MERGNGGQYKGHNLPFHCVEKTYGGEGSEYGSKGRTDIEIKSRENRKYGGMVEEEGKNEKRQEGVKKRILNK
jgi:hypothetical protein